MARDDDARMYELPGYRVRDLGLAESTLERVRAMCEDAHGDYLDADALARLIDAELGEDDDE